MANVAVTCGGSTAPRTRPTNTALNGSMSIMRSPHILRLEHVCCSSAMKRSFFGYSQITLVIIWHASFYPRIGFLYVFIQIPLIFNKINNLFEPIQIWFDVYGISMVDLDCSNCYI
jgi:hypothetical protein